MNFADSSATARLVAGGCDRSATAIESDVDAVAAIPRVSSLNDSGDGHVQVQLFQEVERPAPSGCSA